MEEEKDFEVPKCEKCDLYMLWVAYNKALCKTDPGLDHWECKKCGDKKYD